MNVKFDKLLGLLALLVLSACQGQLPLFEGAPPDRSLYEPLSAQDRESARENLQTSLEKLVRNSSGHWQGESDWAGSVTPLRTYKIKTGHYCRDFQESVFQGASMAVVLATACRDEGGQWQVVKQETVAS